MFFISVTKDMPLGGVWLEESGSELHIVLQLLRTPMSSSVWLEVLKLHFPVEVTIRSFMSVNSAEFRRLVARVEK